MVTLLNKIFIVGCGRVRPWGFCKRVVPRTPFRKLLEYWLVDPR